MGGPGGPGVGGCGTAVGAGGGAAGAGAAVAVWARPARAIPPRPAPPGHGIRRQRRLARPPPRLAWPSPVTGPRVRDLAATIGDALDHAHQRGVLHRDVKPANILVEGDRLWLTDFGIAVLARATGRYTVGTVGTAQYMAPEQVQGDEVGPAADLYSLGCVIFECLTGESPYAGMDMATAMYAHIHEPIPSAGDPGLDELFARALAK